MTAIPKPLHSDRLVEKEARKKARRSSPVRNASGAALPKPEVWHNAKYRELARKRFDCGIKGRPGHVCGPRFGGGVIKNFAHAEPDGRGLKSSDYYGVILCSIGHCEQTETSWAEFQKRYDFDRDAKAREIFESSPWFGKVEVVW